MAQKRVPAEVQNAIQLAKEADWGYSIRNGRVMIVPPDGENLSIGMSPNDQQMKEYRSTLRRYNLVGEGPARTPAEQQELLEKAKEAGMAEATQENKRRQAYEAEQASKRAQAQAAADKAAAATAKGLIPQQPRSKPVVAPKATTTKTPKAKSIDFPEFDKSLLGTMDYSKFQLKDGSYYCIECWQDGTKKTSSAAQGLASHRGFRHNVYRTGNTTPAQEEGVKLPEDIHDAFELLKSIVVENLGNPEESRRADELEVQLIQVKEASEKEAKALNKRLQDSKTEIGELKKKLYDATKELTGKDGVQEAETKALLGTFQSLLEQIRQAVNGLSPAQAVGKIDELLTAYLGS